MLNIVIVCSEDWEKYTKPCIESIQKHEPKAKLIVIDNAAFPPHPKGWWKSIRFDNRVSYPEALNAGLGMIDNNGWIMIANNDILFHKPFTYRVEHYDPNSIYGFYEHKVLGREYISSWAMIFSRALFDKVGLFDENYTPYCYEDTDYCWRAVDKGYYLTAVMRENFGIEHMDKKRITLNDYPECLLYLEKKYGIKDTRNV